MSMNRGLLHKIELTLLWGLFGVILVLLWAVRRAPLAPVPLLLLDAPGAWVALSAWVGATIATLQRRVSHLDGLAFALLISLAALAATPWVMAIFLLASIALASRGRKGSGLLILGGLAALASALVLAIRAAGRYDSPAAGAAVDVLVFGLALLAAVLPLLPLVNHAGSLPFGAVVRVLLLLPLMRLLMLSPWHPIWSLLAALLGGGLALWAALASLARSEAREAGYLLPAMALASLGLASSAGIAAYCFIVLVVAVECSPQTELTNVAPEVYDDLAGAQGRQAGVLPAIWAMFGVFPLGASFIAAWMAVGAAAAAGSTGLAGVLWLAALLRGVVGLIQLRAPRSGQHTRWPAIAALAVGVLAPQIITYGIQPVVEQLQGGLNSYGNLSTARWIGLSMVDSSSRVVITAPTLAAAPLLLVLAAVCVIVVRLWPSASAGLPMDLGESSVHRTSMDVERWRMLVRAVPWLIQERDDADR